MKEALIEAGANHSKQQDEVLKVTRPKNVI
jgi:hypothetical protein